MLRTVEMDFQFQQYIGGPPVSPNELTRRASSNDDTTMDHWREIWVNQTKANHAKHGPFKDHGIGKLFHLFHQRPVIVAGAGPSLAQNIDELKDTKGIPIVSCLHNYQLFEDRGITPDFYVNLDAGPVTIEEIAEGGKKSLDDYFASTKNKKLLAFIGSHPDLINRWQGEVYWFNCPIPDEGIRKAILEIENFNTLVGSGGNVLGACFYIAKGILGAGAVIFTGADFSFSYNNKFHPSPSKYDGKVGDYLRATDIFGNSVKTWQSYLNFKYWIDAKCCQVPGVYINASEGGILGAYPAGNIEQIKQMALSDVKKQFSLSEHLREQCENPDSDNNLILF